MKIVAILVMLMFFAPAAFSISEQKRECVRACCEMSGGTYIPSQNGCNEPGEGMMECAMGCTEPEEPFCFLFPFVLLVLGVLGAIRSG